MRTDNDARLQLEEVLARLRVEALVARRANQKIPEGTNP